MAYDRRTWVDGTLWNDDEVNDWEGRIEDGFVAVGKVLLWNGTTYVPTALHTDTSHPREFRGPANPASIAGIALADYDTWVQNP